jgi:hypothetical protein
MNWANQPTNDTAGSQIFWLTGIAGSGKSAIAQKFQATNCLGSSFYFDVSSQAVRGPQYLFSTISWEVGRFDDAWREALWNVLQGNIATECVNHRTV